MAKNKKVIKEQKKYQALQERYNEIAIFINNSMARNNNYNLSKQEYLVGQKLATE